VRIEDLDLPRVISGKADEILRTLEHHGLEWDGPVMYQSRRIEAYAAACERLKSTNRLFACACTRSTLRSEDAETTAYPGTCRPLGLDFAAHALRFRVDDATQIRWHDRFLGRQAFGLRDLGDFIVKRRDGAFAYHLAVVVDDDAQGISSVVRGSDLLASTPWQLALQQALGITSPTYAHAPLLTEPDGKKLAKSRRSVALDPGAVSRQLITALEILGQGPDTSLVHAPAKEILRWAIENWKIQPLQGRCSVPLEENFVPDQPLY